MKILIRLGDFFYRLYFRLNPNNAKNIIGVPYQRDPDAVCEAYEPFLQPRKQYFNDCETDGHYLCGKCCHRKIES
jgi:hypothetical protein